MSPYMGRLALLLWVGLFVDVSPAHAQVKSAPVRAVPNAAPRRFLPRVGVTNTSGLQALTLNPDAVYAGQSSMVTVELPAPAPAGGAKVVLSASPAGVGTMPPAVTVAAGQSTGSFAVATASGGGNATLEISAARDGSTGKLSALLQVVAALPAITGFAGFPGLLRVGTSATGTVTIAGAAPAGGATIPLYPAVSGDAIVPASVTVAAGQSSASLTISAGQKTGTVKLSTSAVARQQGCPAAPPCASIQVVAVPELATLFFVGGMTTTEG